MATEPGKERVGTPLDADRIDPQGIVEIVVEFDEGEEVLTPKINERFGSYDLNEAARGIGGRARCSSGASASTTRTA